MKVPDVFVPEKNLDDKVRELSKNSTGTKRPFEESYLYDTVYSKLKCALHTLNEGPVKIFWISDKHQDSKYEELDKMINKMIEKSNVKLTYEIHDYYGKEFRREDIIQILNKIMFANQVQIVYVDHKTTETLRGGDDYRDNLLLFNHSYVIVV